MLQYLGISRSPGCDVVISVIVTLGHVGEWHLLRNIETARSNIEEEGVRVVAALQTQQ